MPVTPPVIDFVDSVLPDNLEPPLDIAGTVVPPPPGLRDRSWRDPSPYQPINPSELIWLGAPTLLHFGRLSPTVSPCRHLLFTSPYANPATPYPRRSVVGCK